MRAEQVKKKNGKKTGKPQYEFPVYTSSSQLVKQSKKPFQSPYVAIEHACGEFTDLWNVVVPPLSLLFLQFDGDSSDWTPLDPLHQMRNIPAARTTET